MTNEAIAALATELSDVVSEHVAAAVEPLLKRLADLEAAGPILGPKGEPGEPGRDGAPGRDGSDGKDGAPGIAGKDGAPGLNGKDGAPGRDGSDGKDGRDGAPGRDAVGVKSLFIGRDGNLIATLTDGGVTDLGRVVGRDGEPGADGLGFEDIGAEQVDARTFKLFFARGEVRREFVFEVPTPVDCGVYREGETYRPGDGVTWAGSWWICQTETNDKPETSKAWRLAVKRGRDGRDGKDGERGPEGKEGRAGRDLTQLAADGAKY